MLSILITRPSTNGGLRPPRRSTSSGWPPTGQAWSRRAEVVTCRHRPDQISEVRGSHPVLKLVPRSPKMLVSEKSLDQLRRRRFSLRFWGNYILSDAKSYIFSFPLSLSHSLSLSPPPLSLSSFLLHILRFSFSTSLVNKEDFVFNFA